MRNILLILTCIVFLFAGCAGMDLRKNFIDITEDTGGSAINYTSNTSPLSTDQLLGIDDPSGTWAINRFPISNIWTSIYKGYADALYESIDSAITKSDEAETLSANWVNTANPWADNEVADDISLTNITQITNRAITSLSATNWRLFYSADGSVPVELALGADGTYLMSNGASVAPSFETPAGTGDLKADGTVPLTADWDLGDYTLEAKGFDAKKVSGTAGWIGLHEANSTDTDQIGLMGPASISESWFGQFPDEQPSGQVLSFAAPTGTSGPNGEKTSTITWVTPIVAGGNIGAATATTPDENDNDTSVATTAYVQTEISGFSGGLPTVISGDPDSLDDTLSTNPSLYNGGFIRYNAEGEATLDAFTSSGQSVSILFYPSVAIIVNPNSSQTIIRNGVTLSQGEALINGSSYGLCVLTYLGSNSIDAQCSSSIVEEIE